VIKLTAPGVPDIYQGSEALNFSLVDPDNRREPDFAWLAENLAGLDATVFHDEARWRDGSVKQFVTATLLRMRQHAPALFHYGDWLPLRVRGDRENHLIAWARVKDDAALIVVVPRLVLDVTQRGLGPDPALWANTVIDLAPELAGKRYRDLFTGARRTLDDALDLSSEKGCILVLMTSE